jgi:hypothetical protein
MADDTQSNQDSSENELSGNIDGSIANNDTNNKASSNDLDGNSSSKKNSSKIATTLIIVFCLAVPAYIFFSALQNPAWINTPFAKRIESFVSGALMANINVVTIPTNQVLHPIAGLTKDKMQKIENGDYAIVSATDINTAHGVDKGVAKNRFVIATIGPVDLAGKDTGGKHSVIENVYRSAFGGDIDAVVESTEADIMMSSPWGHPLISRLYESGAIRCVIFDGGHHIGSLGLKPNILLTPVMFYKNELHATHAFTRDSVNIDRLEQTIEREYVGSTIVELSRMGIPVKNSSVMGKLGYQAILNISRLTNQKTSSETGESANNTTQKGKSGDNLKYIPMRSSIVFVSCDVGNSPTKNDIYLAIKSAVEKQVKPGQKVRRVYAGITYGECQFPQKIPVPTYTDKELQDYLLKRLPYYTEMMSEPVSTWDIVKTHL